MKRRACCFAGICLLVVPQYSCHRPTPQDAYAESRRCFVVLDASLRILPAAWFQQAGIDRAAVREASDGELSAAWDTGKRLGMSGGAISSDLERAKATYSRTHNAQAAGNGGQTVLRDDLDDCLGDFYGRPND